MPAAEGVQIWTIPVQLLDSGTATSQIVSARLRGYSTGCWAAIEQLFSLMSAPNVSSTRWIAFGCYWHDLLLVVARPTLIRPNRDTYDCVVEWRSARGSSPYWRRAMQLRSAASSLADGPPGRRRFGEHQAFGTAETGWNVAEDLEQALGMTTRWHTSRTWTGWPPR